MLIRLAFAHKLATVAGAGLLGTATAAAAISADLPLIDPEPDPVEIVEEGVEEPLVLDTVSDGADPSSDAGEIDVEAATDDVAGFEPPVDADGVPYGDGCDAGNHGDYVSSVARDERLRGAGKGSIVSQAARTECGKAAHEEGKAKQGPGEDEDEDLDSLGGEEAAGDPSPALEDPDVEDVEPRTQGNGKGKGKGKSGR